MAIIASVVSTATEEQNRGVGHDLLARQFRAVGGSSEQRGLRVLLIDDLQEASTEVGKRRVPPCPGPRAGGDLGDGSDDRVVPGQHGVDLVRGQPQRPRHRGRSQRAGEGAPQLSSGRAFEQPVDERVGLVLDVLLEAIAHRPGAKRRHERRAVAGVVLAVEAEHARPDDLSRRESRILNGEAVLDRAWPRARGRSA